MPRVKLARAILSQNLLVDLQNCEVIVIYIKTAQLLRNSIASYLIEMDDVILSDEEEINKTTFVVWMALSLTVHEEYLVQVLVFIFDR